MGRWNSPRTLLQTGFPQRFAKKKKRKKEREEPGASSLRRQFCSDHPTSRPGSAFSRSSPGRPRPRDGCTPRERVLLQGVRRDPLPSSPQNSRPSPRACPPGGAALRETKAQGVRQERAPASTTTYRPQRTCACTQWTTALGVQAAGCRGCRDSHALPRGKFLPLGA